MFAFLYLKANFIEICGKISFPSFFQINADISNFVNNNNNINNNNSNNNNNNNNIYFYSANSTVQFSNALYNVKIIS